MTAPARLASVLFGCIFTSSAGAIEIFGPRHPKKCFARFGENSPFNVPRLGTSHFWLEPSCGWNRKGKMALKIKGRVFSWTVFRTACNFFHLDENKFCWNFEIANMQSHSLMNLRSSVCRSSASYVFYQVAVLLEISKHLLFVVPDGIQTQVSMLGLNSHLALYHTH